MNELSSDIPDKCRGQQSIVIAELDGSPIVMPSDINAVAETAHGNVNMSDLPILAKIDGLSDEAVDQISDLVGNWHQETGVPIMPITRSALLKALAGEGNN